MYIYIAYRDLRTHYTQNSMCGGLPYNNDYKFTAINDGIYYLLALNGANYAVSKEAGEKFIEDVLSKSTGEHEGSFPFVQSLNGKDMAAVIERSREVDLNGYKSSRTFHYDMDADVLYQMLEELRTASGEPMDKRALMNYCYPNPTLPEGDYDLTEIYHGIYCKPDNKPNSVIQTVFPDKQVSCFSISKTGAYVQIRVDDNKVMSNVPAELIPEIKEKVRQLCADPKDAYVEHGDWEGFIRFNNDEERIFTDPDKTLELLKDIASKSEYNKTEAVDTNKYYKVGKLPPGGFGGFGMFGMMGGFPAPSVSPAPAATPAASTPAPSPDVKKCAFCGANVTGKFCSECGGKVE